MNTDDHPVCACCNEHFTGNPETDDFLEWEYCEGRKEWSCNPDCRDDWNEEERCDEEECDYCRSLDEDEEDKVICHECNKPCESEEDSDLVLIAMRNNKPICTKCIESK